MGNSNLHRAKVSKNDEFYTKYSNVKSEMSNYEEHFKGKVIYLNCDDPRYSNFWRYFKDNFERLGVKKLISTYYILDEPAFKTEFDGKKEVKTRLIQNGNFLSTESIITLRESDLVITNPPFSLFGRFIKQMVRFNKDFIILGSLNAVSFRDIFPLIKEDKVRLGKNRGNMEFIIPKNAVEKTDQRIDNKGVRYQKISNIVWYTTLDYEMGDLGLELEKDYKEGDYESFDDNKAINVDRLKDIPKGYDGLMGVPITYIMKHDPDKFDIKGVLNNVKRGKYILGSTVVKGEEKYVRIVIQKKGGFKNE